ncbi:MAG: hypothetical protein NXI19_04700 [Alphaproteobacteria bacterium]|nr:hypothetical protein [Alphaproteobacteria bacterium]
MADPRELELFVLYMDRNVSPWEDGDIGAMYGERFIDKGWADRDDNWLLVPTAEGWLRIAEETFKHARIRPGWMPAEVVDGMVRSGQLVSQKQPRPKPALFRLATDDC